MNELKYLVDKFERALLLVDRSEVERIFIESLEMGSPIQIATELVTKALERIGCAWEQGNLSLSQVYMSGILCEELIDKILPPMSLERRNRPQIAIAVFEDFHVLGKRIIYSTLRATGFELMDLGSGLNAKAIIEKVAENNIKILLLSVLMLPSALKIKHLIEQLSNSDVKIIVGGAPFRLDKELWKEVGAYAMGKDSSEAITIVTKLMDESV
ncbi:MAG: cobalamin B12-binding domain-containing protein [Ignavibacteriales bacterium]|nr:cobalamin B12-binding domain-containing protein [Ignavibacteriales bacterium]